MEFTDFGLQAKVYSMLNKEQMREYQRMRRAKAKEVTLNDERRPDEATDAQWAYALERAERARIYAIKFPDHVRPSEQIFQDPLWQWENEVRKIKA